MKYIKIILSVIILTSVGILCYTRWDAWFTNPPETIWQQDTVVYHFYGFGEDSIPGFITTDNYFQDTIEPDILRFLVLGDVHNNVDSTQFSLMYHRHQPLDFYAQLGDFMERNYFCYHQLLVRELIGTGFDSLPIIITPGNHEYQKGIIRHLNPVWYTWFNNPKNGPKRFLGSTYYADFKNLRFITIDTNGLQHITDYTTTLTWLNKAMQSAGNKFIVVMMHHPVFSGAIDRQNIGIKTTFYMSLRHADIVFSGHDHLYTRRLPFIGINSAKKFYLSKVNTKDERICSGQQLYEIVSVKEDTLKVETFLMDSGEKYDEIVVVKQDNGTRKYIDLFSGKKELIDLPEKYINRNDMKVKRFLKKRNQRYVLDSIQ